MEHTRTETIERETNLNSFANNHIDNNGRKERLESLIAANTEYARREEIFKDDYEELAAELMENPYSTEKAFSIFGLLLGSIPPAAVFGKWAYEGGMLNNGEAGWLLLFFIVNFVSAITGYFSGKTVGKIVKQLEKQSWTKMLLAMPFVGLLWGFISGGAGGIFVFLIGAIFGAVIGGLVGGVALPTFAALHRMFKKGDQIDSRHFYPIAFGITFVISAIIIGM